jgi:putative flippase GtrA
MNELQHEADFSDIRSRHLLSGPRLPPVLTVVVPTFNESANVRTRKSGNSKFDLRNAVDFAALILAKLTRNIVPLRFFSFLLVGGSGMIPALLTFYAVCSIGALSNASVSSWLYSQHAVWWLAGIAGSLVGAVWNYIGSSVFVWKRA